jgi:hypothetical protein
MRRKWGLSSICLLIFILSACSSSPLSDAEDGIVRSDTLILSTTAYTEEAKTNTRTPGVTSEQASSLSPTAMPLFTPTSNFDFIFLPTCTPAEPALCPQQVADPPGLADLVEFLEGSGIEEANRIPELLLEVLNAGGAEHLYQTLRVREFPSNWFAYDDLTNDGIPEFIIRVRGPVDYLNVYGCDQGDFTILLEEPIVYGTVQVKIQDLNRNGIQNLVMSFNSCEWCRAVSVFEWDGERFRGLVQDWYIEPFDEQLVARDFAELPGYASVSLKDIDSNGTIEILLQGGKPSYLAGMSGREGPYREQTIVFMWNGEHYVWYSQHFDPADFRFQTLQDADEASQRGEWDVAQALYQEVVYSDELASWKREAWDALIEENEGSFIPPNPSDLPFNPVEYDQLSAYARFRILLLHLLRGWNDDAETVFENLEMTYDVDSAGYPYVEMADVFWSIYTTSGDIGEGCSAVIEFVQRRPELLLPLGSSDHGLFTIQYEAYMVCPY